MKRRSKILTAIFMAFLAVAICTSFFFKKKEVVIKWPCIWVGQDSKANTVATLVDQFNAAHEGKIRVEIEPQPNYDAYEDKIRASIAAGQVPDVFTMKLNPTTAAFYDGDILMDFKEELNKGWKNDFISSNLAECEINGAIKTLPYETALTPIWVNEALFKQVGVDSFPKTFDEFWTACDKLKAAGFVPMSHMTGGSNAWTSMLWYSHLVAGFGGPDVMNKPFDDPAYVKAAEILLKMYSDGNTTKDAVGGDAGVSGGHFLAGRTAVFINGPWYIGRVKKDAPEVYAQTKILSAPQVAGGQGGAQVGFLLTNFAAANTKDKKKKEAVVTFLKWMTQPDNVKQISLAAGSLFAVKFDVGSGDNIDPLQKQFVEASNNATFTVKALSFAVNNEVVTAFGQELGKMALGKSTPEEFVAALKKKLK
ncbi:MAG: ABC transporter substrate-binding protein [Spirochaetes bacterium]|nr:ABC transporter substrate-binding protein [Spirochaetota bacterium]